MEERRKDNDRILTEIVELKTSIGFLIEDIKEIKDGVKTINGRGWENKTKITSLENSNKIIFRLGVGIVAGLVTIITLILSHIL